LKGGGLALRLIGRPKLRSETEEGRKSRERERKKNASSEAGEKRHLQKTGSRKTRRSKNFYLRKGGKKMRGGDGILPHWGKRGEKKKASTSSRKTIRRKVPVVPGRGGKDQKKRQPRKQKSNHSPH